MAACAPVRIHVCSRFKENFDGWFCAFLGSHPEGSSAVAILGVGVVHERGAALHCVMRDFWVFALDGIHDFLNQLRVDEELDVAVLDAARLSLSTNLPAQSSI